MRNSSRIAGKRMGKHALESNASWKSGVAAFRSGWQKPKEMQWLEFEVWQIQPWNNTYLLWVMRAAKRCVRYEVQGGTCHGFCFLRWSWMSIWKQLLSPGGEFLWPFGVTVRYGCVFSLSSVLRAPLTLFPLHTAGRPGLPSLLSAHPSPLKSHLRKVMIIKSCASGLQRATCKEQDLFYFFSFPQLTGFILCLITQASKAWCVPCSEVGLWNRGVTNARSWAALLVFGWHRRSPAYHHVEMGRNLSGQTDVNVWSPFLGCFSAARILPDFLLFAGSLVSDGALVSVYWVFNSGHLSAELL